MQRRLYIESPPDADAAGYRSAEVLLLISIAVPLRAGMHDFQPTPTGHEIARLFQAFR